MRGLVIACVMLLCAGMVFSYYPGDPYYRGCVFSTDDEIFQDVDCDKVADVYDNCPLVINAEQVDVDRNGVGDACDLLITEIRPDPEQPIQGRSMLTNVKFINNREYPMRNLLVKVEVPRLGIAETEKVSILQPGELGSVDILLRIPECANPEFTDVVAIIEYPVGPGQNEVFPGAVKIPVIASGYCHSTGDDRTVVNILETQDIDPIEGGLYPFTVKNNQLESRSYVLSVDGYQPWGRVDILSGSVMVIPSGETRDGALRAYSDVGGKHSFTFTIDARDDIEQVLLLADVPEQVRPQRPPGVQMLLGILAFVGILILIAIVIVFTKSRHKDRMLKETHPEPHKERVKKAKSAKAPKKKKVKKK